MKIHPLQGIGHIRVLFYSPIVFLQVIGNYFIIGQQKVSLPHQLMLVAIQDIGLGGFVVAGFDQHFFDQVLYLLYRNDFVAGIYSIGYFSHLISQFKNIFIVLSSYCLGSLPDGIHDFLFFKRY